MVPLRGGVPRCLSRRRGLQVVVEKILDDLLLGVQDGGRPCPAAIAKTRSRVCGATPMWEPWSTRELPLIRSALA